MSDYEDPEDADFEDEAMADLEGALAAIEDGRPQVVPTGWVSLDEEPVLDSASRVRPPAGWPWEGRDYDDVQSHVTETLPCDWCGGDLFALLFEPEGVLNRVRVLSCQHVLHATCFSQGYGGGGTCPACGEFGGQNDAEQHVALHYFEAWRRAGLV